MKKEKKEKKVEFVPAEVKLQKFLEKENMQVAAQPQFRQRDDGTFSIVVGFTVDYKQAK